MMTFRQLTVYWEQLKHQTAHTVQHTTCQELLAIMHAVTNCQGDLDHQLLQIKSDQVKTALDNFEHTLQEFKTQVRTQLDQLEPQWLLRSLEWYKDTLVHKFSQHDNFLVQHRNKRAFTSEENHTLFVSRTMRHSDWHYPAMIIHPGLEPYMQHLVGHDPLYIVDESQALLDQLVIQNYNPVYQRRLRPYVIEETFDSDILQRLPVNQFGLCFVYNFFNFRPVEMIEKYLAEIHAKLKPGGVLIMTFNNCDHVGALDLVDNNYACYATEKIIRDMAVRQNYEIDFFWDRQEAPGAWIELRKPGQLTSLRAGQTLAKIVPMHKHPDTVAQDS